MKAWIGKSVIIIGILHSIVGFVAFHDILLLLFNERLFNTVSLKSAPQREAAFWFLLTGATLIIVGALVDWVERRDIGLPVFLLWSFISITAIGILIMPVSGVWLLLIPTYGFLRRRRRITRVDGLTNRTKRDAA